MDEGIKIKLPQARAAAPQTQQEITVYVDADGRAFLMSKQISEDDLFKEIRKMIDGNKDRLVVVKADRTVALNKAVKVMDLAKAAGAARLCLATEKGL